VTFAIELRVSRRRGSFRARPDLNGYSSADGRVVSEHVGEVGDWNERQRALDAGSRS
jgi:hypothetical protein